MSTFVGYRPENFGVEARFPASRVGEFVVGLTKIGDLNDGFVALEMANFNYTAGYSVDSSEVNEKYAHTHEGIGSHYVMYTIANPSTLIYDSETASVSKSYWGDPPEDLPFKVGARFRVAYTSHDNPADNWFEYTGIVDSVKYAYGDVPEAKKRGKPYKTTVTATLLGEYVVMLSRRVCWNPTIIGYDEESGDPITTPALWSQPWIDRIRNWVTVTNWPGDA